MVLVEIELLAELEKHLLDLSGAHRLRALELRGCHTLTEVRGLETLTQLTKVDLRACAGLVTSAERSSLLLAQLRSLTDLTELSLSDVEGLISVDALSALKKLQGLTLIDCQALTDVSVLVDFKALTQLDLSGCINIDRLGLVSRLTQLETLTLSRCPQLHHWVSRREMRSLRALRLDGSGILSIHLSNSPKLECLSLSACTKLTKLEAHDLPQLRELNVNKLTSLSRVTLSDLPLIHELNLRKSSALTHLHLERLESLKSVTCSDRALQAFTCLELPQLSERSLEVLAQSPRHLKDLKLSRLLCVRSLKVNAPQVERVMITHIPMLTTLDLSGCSSLYTLSDLKGVSRLEELIMKDCASLERLPQLVDHNEVIGSSALIKLNLSGCVGLKSLPNFASINELTHLDLSGCTCLYDLSHLTPAKQLKSLKLRECDQLYGLFGIKDLTELRELDLSRYHPSLMGVVDLRELTHLERLWPTSLWKLIPRMPHT